MKLLIQLENLENQIEKCCNYSSNGNQSKSLKFYSNSKSKSKNLLYESIRVSVIYIYKLISDKHEKIAKKKKYIHDSRSLNSECATSEEEKQNLKAGKRSLLSKAFVG